MPQAGEHDIRRGVSGRTMPRSCAYDDQAEPAHCSRNEQRPHSSLQTKCCCVGAKPKNYARLGKNFACFRATLELQLAREFHRPVVSFDVCYTFLLYKLKMATNSTRFQVDTAADGKQVLSVAGDWTVWTVASIEQSLKDSKVRHDATLDVSQLETLDTSGAYLIDRALGAREGND